MNTQLGKGRRGKPVDSETTENWTQVANSTHRDPNPKDKSLIRKTYLHLRDSSLRLWHRFLIKPGDFEPTENWMQVAGTIQETQTQRS